MPRTIIFKWKCQIGKALQRKFSVTGFPDNVGTYTLELEIYEMKTLCVGAALRL